MRYDIPFALCNLSCTNPISSLSKQCAAWLSPLQRVGLPDDVARAVCFLASDAAEWVNGKIIGIDGGAFR